MAISSKCRDPKCIRILGEEIVHVKDDGDTVSIKPVFTKEANAECEKRIQSVAYVLNVEGKLIRNATKDFTLCAYNLTRVEDGKDTFLTDVNKDKPKYII